MVQLYYQNAMSGPRFPNGFPQANIHPGVPLPPMLDLRVGLPNLTSEVTSGPFGPVIISSGTSQEPVTSRLRINSIVDDAPLNYKKGGAMFHYTGKDGAAGVKSQYLALSIQNLNEYLARTSMREIMRIGGLVGTSEPQWNEKLYEMLYDPEGTLLPLGAMWTNDEGEFIRQREVTLSHAGDMSLVPNLWNIHRYTAQFVGFAIKKLPRTFTYAANGKELEMVTSVRAKINGKHVTVDHYVPQIVPIVETGNAGPLLCADLDDIAKPGTPRWNRELVYEAPRVFRRGPALQNDNYKAHGEMAREFVQMYGGAHVRPEAPRDVMHTALPDDKSTDFEEMDIHTAPYFRFGQVRLITKAFTAPVESYHINPENILDKAVCSFPEDIKLRKASHLLISLSQNPAYSWRR